MTERFSGPAHISIPAWLTSVWLVFTLQSVATAAQVVPPDPEGEYVGMSYTYPGKQWVIVGDSVVATPLDGRPYPLVVGIVPCSPAHHAGIEPGDTIERVGDRDGRETPLFPDSKPPNSYQLTVRREDTVLSLTLRTTTRPAATPKTVSDEPLGPVEDWDCSSSAGSRRQLW